MIAYLKRKYWEWRTRNYRWHLNYGEVHIALNKVPKANWDVSYAGTFEVTPDFITAVNVKVWINGAEIKGE